VTVLVELHGLELSGRHGALEWERETEQRFLYDVELELHEPAGDALADTVDYREVVALVREVSATHFELLESLAAAVAEALLARFPAVAARVRVRKPDVELEAPVEYAAASVRRERP
jgi:dihydroneopterin aldolase